MLFFGRLALVALLCLLCPRYSLARNIDPGRLYLGGAIGPGLSIGSKLGTAPADLLLSAVGEWTWNRAWSTTGAATFGFGGTMPVMGRIGARLRAHDLGLAISPYAQWELAGGGLMHVLGSRLRTLGTRLGGGVDYFATGNVTLGVGLGIYLGSTLGERPAFYGLADAMLYVTYAVNRPLAAGATTHPNSH